jgi:hypothetical protein
MLRNKFVVMAVAVLLAAVAAYNYSFFSSKGQRKPAAPEQALRTGGEETVGAAVAPASAPRYRSVWRRDPFWYSGGVDRNRHDVRSAPKIAGTGIELTGTMTKDGKGYALINGSVYGVGDKVQNATIVEVGELYIKVRTSEGTRTIRIDNDLIEKEK